ncbi:MAG: ribonuclease III [Clostridiales bacterium]|nr:ribonuclease III [Clostridiales bacterium]
MNKNNYLNMNTTVLAFMGDAVYETYIRDHVIKSGKTHAERLHKDAVKFVRAEAQSAALKLILDNLSEEEISLVKRARNKKSSTRPKNVDPVDYKWATALEALIGYLYLSGQIERMEEIIEDIMVKIGEINGEKTG